MNLVTTKEEKLPVTNRDIEMVESELLKLPQIDCPLSHLFAPGVYCRELFMPKGTFVIGHEHKTEHFNVVLSGRATVMMNGVIHEIVAPCIFVSKPGVRKAFFIKEDMRWATIHPTPETDLEKLEEELITKSGGFLDYHNSIEVKQLMAHVEHEQEK